MFVTNEKRCIYFKMAAKKNGKIMRLRRKKFGRMDSCTIQVLQCTLNGKADKYSELIKRVKNNTNFTVYFESL